MNAALLLVLRQRRRWEELEATGYKETVEEHYARLDRELQERFWAKVDKGWSFGCWQWMGGTTSDGYGSINTGFKTERAHRLAWRWAHGDQEIPPGHYICHTCDNPGCVNPDHLFLGTPGDNARDKVAKGHQRGGWGYRR